MRESFSQWHKLSADTQYAGVRWTKVVRAPATPQLGLDHDTISDIRITICFTIYCYNFTIWSQTTNFSVLFIFWVALAHNTTGITTAITMAAAGGNAPLAPHMRSCAQRRRVEWMGNNPLSLRMYFWGGVEGVYGPQSASGDDALPQNHSVLGAMQTPTAPKIISACSGGYRPSIWRVSVERKVSCGGLGGHFCRRGPWSAMVVMVVGGVRQINLL
jgi:hypothetical protein